tara:strand:- start:3754 stop:4341 length:588 start_codon:yes stop_codon:yes gene_type:complete
MSSIFWGNDIHVLYENNNYLLFFPKCSNTLAENLNVLVRISIYFSMIYYVISLDINSFIPLLLVMGLTIIMYNYKKNEKYDNYNKEDVKVKKLRKSTPDNPMMNPVVHINDGKCADINDTNIDKNLVGNLSYEDGELDNLNLLKRNFYTAPVNCIPNDQTEFAKWLYGKPNCKSGHVEECNKNLDNLINLNTGSF